MNSKVVLGARLLLGLLLVVFGANKFGGFLPVPDLSPEAGAYWGAIMSANILYVVGAVELLSGIALLANKFVPLALIANVPVLVNILLFHFFLAPEILVGPTIPYAILLILLMAANKDKYAELIKA